MKSHQLVFYLLIALGAILFLLRGDAFSLVISKDGKTFLVDRTGEQWEITQAVSIGFHPERFEYGLGKNAFTPLDDRHVSDPEGDEPWYLRVLGISEGSKAKAYSIPKLRGHEVANSTIGEKPIAAAY